MRPCCITATREASCATTGKLCEIRIIVSENSRCSSREQLQNLRAHGDVQRGDRLIRDEQLRPEDQRARDSDALALAAGKFVRIARLHLGAHAHGL